MLPAGLVHAEAAPQAHAPGAQPAGRAPDLNITPEVIDHAQELEDAGTFTRQAVSAVRATRGQKVVSGVKFAGGLVREISQVEIMIIWLSALNYQASQDLAEMQKLKNEQPSAQPTPATTGTCQPGGGGLSNTLCSGEFILGAALGSGLLAVNKVAGAVLTRVFKSLKGRLAFLTVLGSISANVSTLVVATGTSFLWSQAVQLLPEIALCDTDVLRKQYPICSLPNHTPAKLIEQAKGLAGRALVARASGHYDAFRASDDGKVFNQILSNMWDILYKQPKLREKWMYNAWRFGMARGDVIAAMGTVIAVAGMESAVAATTTAGVTATFGTAAAGTATAEIGGSVFAFIVASALGAVSAYYLISYGVPQSLTQAMQNLRLDFDQSQLDVNRNFISATLDAMAIENRGLNNFFEDPAFWDEGKKLRFLNERIAMEKSDRDNVVNVLIEKFYELEVEAENMRHKIDVAKAVLADPTIRQALRLPSNGQMVTFAQAQQAWCAGKGAQCSAMPDAFQLQELDKYTPILEKAENDLAVYALQIPFLYSQDADLADKYFNDDNIALRSLAEPLSDFQVESAALHDHLTILLAGFSDRMAREFHRSFKGKQKELAANRARTMFSEYYTQSFDGDEVFSHLKYAVMFP